MRVTQEGKDLTLMEVEMECGVCGTLFREEASRLAASGQLYHNGMSLAASGVNCPRCRCLFSGSVESFYKE